MINPKDLSDLEVFTLTIYGEARGESIEGQVAVANVIKNRCKNGRTYKEVCLAPLQFSCWNESDPNYSILLDIGEQMILGQDINNPSLLQCDFVARGIDEGMVLDNTHSARNYLTKHLYYSERAPKWAKTMPTIVEIGNHVFGTSL